MKKKVLKKKPYSTRKVTPSKIRNAFTEAKINILDIEDKALKKLKPIRKKLIETRTSPSRARNLGRQIKKDNFRNFGELRARHGYNTTRIDELKNYGFENFKIFKNNTNINLSKCNAILGSNGVGKSSIFEIIQLLNQSQLELPNTIDTYDGLFKQWNNPKDIFFKKNKNEKIIFSFNSAIDILPERKDRYYGVNESRAKLLNNVMLDNVDLTQIIFKCMQKEALEKNWKADEYILDQSNFDYLIKELGKKNSTYKEDSNAEFCINMNYKIEVVMGVINIDSKSEDLLQVVGIKIFDDLTNNLLLEYKMRKDVKISSNYFTQEYQRIGKFKNKKVQTIKSLEKIQKQINSILNPDDLIQVDFCSSKKTKRFWEIFQIIIQMYYKTEAFGLAMANNRVDVVNLELMKLFTQIDPESIKEYCCSNFVFYKNNFLMGGKFLKETFSYSNRLFEEASYKRSHDIFENDFSTTDLDMDRSVLRYLNRDPYKDILTQISGGLTGMASFGAFRGGFAGRREFFDVIFKSLNDFLSKSRFVTSIHPSLTQTFTPSISKDILEDLDENMHQTFNTDAIIEILYRHKNIRSNVNLWLKKIGLNYKLSVANTSKPSERLKIRVFAEDLELKATKIDLQDIGYGAFQAIRLVLILLTFKDKNIFLSEPEQNLHPSIHINLLNLIQESIKKNGNKVFIETHSENVVLKMLKMVRDKEFRYDEIIINVVTKDKDGGKINQIEILENGDVASDWPNGFFMDRYHLVD